MQLNEKRGIIEFLIKSSSNSNESCNSFSFVFSSSLLQAFKIALHRRSHKKEIYAPQKGYAVLQEVI